VVGYEKNFAVKFVNNLIQSEPQNPMLYWVLGEVYAENKEYRRAITYLHKSLDLDNRQSKVRMSLAKSLEAVGELEKAVAEYRLSSLLDRRNSEGFYRAADLLFQMRSYNQSEEVLKFLMNVTPNYPGVHRYLSKIHQLREQKDAAY
jgi:predicted Zn-dependent protease